MKTIDTQLNIYPNGEKVYILCNTAEYDNGDLITITIATTTQTVTNLSDLGLDPDEIKEVEQLRIGESYTGTDYGNGVVIVRLS